MHRQMSCHSICQLNSYKAQLMCTIYKTKFWSPSDRHCMWGPAGICGGTILLLTPTRLTADKLCLLVKWGMKEETLNVCLQACLARRYRTARSIYGLVGCKTGTNLAALPYEAMSHRSAAIWGNVPIETLMLKRQEQENYGPASWQKRCTRLNLGPIKDTTELFSSETIKIRPSWCQD